MSDRAGCQVWSWRDGKYGRVSKRHPPHLRQGLRTKRNTSRMPVLSSPTPRAVKRPMTTSTSITRFRMPVEADQQDAPALMAIVGEGNASVKGFSHPAMTRRIRIANKCGSRRICGSLGCERPKKCHCEVREGVYHCHLTDQPRADFGIQFNLLVKRFSTVW